jgi:hypothetical protein
VAVSKGTLNFGVAESSIFLKSSIGTRKVDPNFGILRGATTSTRAPLLVDVHEQSVKLTGSDAGICWVPPATGLSPLEFQLSLDSEQNYQSLRSKEKFSWLNMLG